jgi:protein-S-isoprenylcysteine O-methyltransferase Ste14
MGKALAVVYGVVAYLLFLAVFGYLTLFLADLLVPKTVDRGAGVARGDGAAVAVALGWLALFGVQHSVMARAWFKRWWTRIVPAAIERSTYVLVSAVLFGLLLWIWTPIPRVVWHVDAPAARIALHGLAFAGWALLLLATFLISHLEFTGLRQVLDHARTRPPTDLPLHQPWLYRVVRHPMYLGLVVGLWSVPTMTLGHLVLAAGLTTYLLIGVRFEERDLERRFGDAYRRYRADVPMLVPLRRPRPGPAPRGSAGPA